MDQKADILWMEAIDILKGVHRVQHVLSVYLLGDRHLHKYAMDLAVFVEAMNYLEQLAFARLRRQPHELARHADLFASLSLVADIDFAGWVFADEHRGQARRTRSRLTRCDRRANFGERGIGHPAAIENACRHARLRAALGGRVRRGRLHEDGVENSPRLPWAENSSNLASQVGTTAGRSFSLRFPEA